MKMKKTELLELQTNGEKANNSQSNSNENIERVTIKNSPFTAIKVDNQWILTMGNKMICREKFEKFGHVLSYIKTHQWELIGIMIIIYNELTKEYETKQSTTKKSTTKKTKTNGNN